MINLSEIVSVWPVVNGWSIAPKGASICKAGSRFKVGKNCTAGHSFKAGNGFTAGDGFKAGHNFTAGHDFTAGNGCSNLIDIGYADGYRKTIGHVNGIAYIGAGCRWFTLADALNHWGNHEKDRSMTMCLLESTKAIAAKNGWKFE